MLVLHHGGKTTYIAELMKNIGNIKAWDLYEHRTNLIEQNAKRLGINIINTQVKDATIEYEEYNSKFDKILLDVPCSGIGVIKRKPDIKWQREETDLQEITKIQRKILQNCSKYVKKGGIIVYSTCSIFKAENSTIIKDFVRENGDFEIQKILNNQDFLEIYPNEIQDGFFIAKLIKK